MALLRKGPRKFAGGGYLYGQKNMGSVDGALGGLGSTISQVLPPLMLPHIAIQRARPVDVAGVQTKLKEQSQTAAQKALDDLNKQFNDALSKADLTVTHKQMLNNEKNKIEQEVYAGLAKNENYFASNLNRQQLLMKVSDLVNSANLQKGVTVKRLLDKKREEVVGKGAQGDAYFIDRDRVTTKTNDDFFNTSLTQDNQEARRYLGINENNPYGQVKTPTYYGNFEAGIKGITDLANQIRTSKVESVQERFTPYQEANWSEQDPTARQSIEGSVRQGSSLESNSKRLNYYAGLLGKAGHDGRGNWRNFVGPEIEASLDAGAAKEWLQSQYEGPDKVTVKIPQKDGSIQEKEVSVKGVSNRQVLELAEQVGDEELNSTLQQARIQFSEANLSRIVQEVFTMGRVTNRSFESIKKQNVSQIAGTGKNADLEAQKTTAAMLDWAGLQTAAEKFTPRDEKGNVVGDVSLRVATLPKTNEFIQKVNAAYGGGVGGKGIPLSEITGAQVMTSDFTRVASTSRTVEQNNAASRLKVNGATGRVVFAPGNINPRDLGKYEDQLRADMKKEGLNPEDKRAYADFAARKGYRPYFEMNILGHVSDFQASGMFNLKKGKDEKFLSTPTLGMVDDESVKHFGLREASDEEQDLSGSEGWFTHGNAKIKVGKVFVEMPNVGLGENEISGKSRTLINQDRDAQAKEVFADTVPGNYFADPQPKLK